jgi:hypothetical protein
VSTQVANTSRGLEKSYIISFTERKGMVGINLLHIKHKRQHDHRILAERKTMARRTRRKWGTIITIFQRILFPCFVLFAVFTVVEQITGRYGTKQDVK